MDLFAVIVVSLEGRIDIILNNMMNIFGFSDPQMFEVDEFHYFLNCFFIDHEVFRIHLVLGKIFHVDRSKTS